eukprot:98859_1
MATKPRLYSQSAHSLPIPYGIATQRSTGDSDFYFPMSVGKAQSGSFVSVIKSKSPRSIKGTKDDSYLNNLSPRSRSNRSLTHSFDRKALLSAMGTDSAIRVQQQHRKCRSMLTATVLGLSVCALVFVFILDVFHLSHDEPFTIAGLIGLWPTYGGSAMNQQSTTSSILNTTNIHQVSINCTYTSPGGIGFTGYVTIDDQNFSYFSDASGYITSVHLDTCQPQWRTHIGTLLGFNTSIKVASYQTLTLFQDSSGEEGLIFGAPTSRSPYFDTNYPTDAGCYAIAVHLNGSFWWKVLLGGEENNSSDACTTHGFTVDDDYAYGGIAQSASYDLEDKQFMGRYFMIDIDQHEIVNVWYPFPDTDSSSDRTYAGIAMYNFPAIIGDYVIFGTSNLWRTPTNIDECLSTDDGNMSIDYDEYLDLDDCNYRDVCGQDRSDNKYYRCLEKDLYPSSLVILNKHTFYLEHAFTLQGLDVFYGLECLDNVSYSSNCPSAVGFNADLTAVAAFYFNEELYVAASQKSARLHVLNVKTGELVVSRKYGPQSTNGQFGMAVDEASLIGITSINGDGAYGRKSRYTLANGVTVCATGSIQAFDVRTGEVRYQIVNPYGYINDSYCLNDSIWDQYQDYTELSGTNCEYPNPKGPSETATVIIPPMWGNGTMLPMYWHERAMFRAPVTIVNDMVIIPSDTGDIWIHDLHDGSFIHHFVCPNTRTEEGQWNRAGIKGGVSVVNDRIVFYCGAYWTPGSKGNVLVSMKLT